MISNRVGSPVRGEDFYGRDKFVELIWKKLEKGHVLLAAPRRFGKTSVMYRLIDVPKENYKIINADLEHLIEPAELIAALIVQLASDSSFAKLANGLSYFPKTLWTRFRSNFEEVELLKVKIKLREQLRVDWQEKGEELFKLISKIDKTVVFILDEFPMMIDRMARSEEHRENAKTLLRWLRRHRQSRETSNVRFLIAGSIGIGQVLNELGEIASINDFEQVRLQPFTTTVAQKLLDELSKTQRIEMSISAKKKVLECIGEPIPYFIQLMFSEVEKEYLITGAKITPPLVEKVYRERVLGVDCKTYFDHYYGRIRDYYSASEEKAVKRLLCELAVKGQLTRPVCFEFCKKELGGDLEVEAFNSMMTNLENDFYVMFELQQREFRFASKLLRDWWLRHYAMEAAL
jgi:uncharacterized protein